MSITIPKTVLQHGTHAVLASHAEKVKNWRREDSTLEDGEITDEVIEDLIAAAEKAADKKVGRVAAAVLSARQGNHNMAIPSLHAAPEMIKAFLREDLLDGWLYMEGRDGHHYPHLVTDVQIVTRRDESPMLSISLAYASPLPQRHGGRGVQTTTVTFEPGDVARKKVEALLSSASLRKETVALRAEYDQTLANYQKVLTTGFARQFRYTGHPTSTDGWKTPNKVDNHKVIHDLRPDEIASFGEAAPTVLFDSPGSQEGDGSGSLPIHSNLPVFDLVTHEFITVHTNDLESYKYDKALREKIILPEDQRNLLDILTSDLEAFTADVIEGKSAGNVILCKGKPGVGKTLTAEVYSELIERPLYSIHSGNLGVSAEDVRKNLETIFKRAKRWDAVLLLDEADVFVLQRGESIQQNAIVAEFLRTMEYFTGLLFMTTNRADDVDDAILSRAAAIIDYEVPGKDAIRQVWLVQAENNKVVIPEGTLDALISGFVEPTPRDVTMLLRLALRMGGGKVPPIETFAKCAMFRGMHYKGV